MIFTKISGNLKDDASVKSKHIETAMVKSDDLSKVILRVKSDHGNEFGIRLSDDEKLENGSYFIIDEGHILALSVIPEEMIIITPKDINDMGVIAHTLGNLHKPVQVRDGKISLLYDHFALKKFSLRKHFIMQTLVQMELISTKARDIRNILIHIKRNFKS